MIIEKLYKPAYIPKVEDFVLAHKEDNTLDTFKIIEERIQGKDSVRLIPLNHTRTRSISADYAPQKEADIKEGKAIREALSKIKEEYKEIQVVPPTDVKMILTLHNTEF